MSGRLRHRHHPLFGERALLSPGCNHQGRSHLLSGLHLGAAGPSPSPEGNRGDSPMSQFRYTGRDAQGAKVTGTLQSASSDSRGQRAAGTDRSPR